MILTRPIDIKTGDKILISRTDRMGDLILAIPFIETLKARYPESKIQVIASDYAAPVLWNNPHIDGIIEVDRQTLQNDSQYQDTIVTRLKREEFRAVIVLFPERQVSRLFKKAEISIRIGTIGRFHFYLFNRYLRHSRKKNAKHESEYNFDFLKFFRAGPIVKTPRIYLRDEEKEKARELLKAGSIENGFVVLHPGSGGSSYRWPLDKFIRLYDNLSKNGISAIITGSAEEGRLIDSLSSKPTVPLKKITGETDLRILAAVLSLADLVVANSTGPLHLAAAVGTKVVGLYPADQKMSSKRWGPLGDGHSIILPPGDSDTSNMGKNQMDLITVEKVAQTVLSIMNRTLSERSIKP
jgi:heptosyltransferase-3